MTDEKPLTCAACIFFVSGADDSGACWRYPPTPLPMMTEPPKAIQVAGKTPQGIAIAAIRPPVTPGTLACGEYDDGLHDGVDTVGGTD